MVPPEEALPKGTLHEELVPDDVALAGIVIPPAVEALIRDCETRYFDFNERTRDEAAVSFVQSDLRAVYRGLAWIRERGLAPGNALLEWGSGVGAVTLLGCSLGFAASGIEVEPMLVEDAGELAELHALEAAFACGSFIPDDADVSPQDMGEFAWLDTSTPAAYDELGLDPDDFDLIFAYPWPGEMELLHALFEAHAARGACFLTYHGLEGLRLHRKP